MPCRTHLVELRTRQADLDRAGLTVRAITFEAPERLRAFMAIEPFPYPVYSDPERAWYRRFRLTTAAARSLYTPGTVWAYLWGMLRGRRFFGWAGRDVHQLGGDILVSAEGAVLFEHRSADPADRPAIDVLLRAAQRQPS